ncbi:hypothetical protein [Oceanicaulis alexandrii]|uniref:hypothetical protein n=1 Tax=Oceanicaulis alexandrii TaxID=153233 RepID=UPI003B504E25
MSKQAPSRTSFSAGRSDLPGEASKLESRRGELRAEFEKNRDPMIAAQRADLAKTEAERRASQMVKQDRPKPVQRPSPALAHGPDGTSFNARWQAERRDAAKDADRNARKAAFKAKRQSQSTSRNRSHDIKKGDQHER